MKIIYLLIFLALAGTAWGVENQEEVMPMCADNIFRDCSAPEISNTAPHTPKFTWEDRWKMDTCGEEKIEGQPMDLPLEAP